MSKKPMSAEGRANISAAWYTPKRIAQLASAEYRAKMSAVSKQTWSSPENKAAISAAIRAVRSSPESRAKTSAASKKNFQDPE